MSSPGSGLRSILPAMVLASGLGYAVQVMAPVLLSAADYVGFSLFWSALFLCVSALSGVQNEVSRAAREADGPNERGTFLRYAGVVLAVSAAVAVVVAFIVASTMPAGDLATVVILFVVGVVSVAVITLLTGVLYGTRRWRGVAVAIVADPVIRALGFAAVIGVMLVTSGWPVPLPIALAAVATPFLLAAAVIWFGSAHAAVSSIHVDIDLARLLKNTALTLLASTALGFVVAGMPIVVTALGRDYPKELVAGTVLLVVLMRAPLVSPMIALQSYLTVTFRDAPQKAWRRAALVVGGLAVVAAALAVVAALWAKPIAAAIVPQYVLPDQWVIAAIVIGAGMVGAQTVTGAVLLSRSLHRAYAAGWVTTALVTVALSLLRVDFSTAVVLSLTIPVLIGSLVHVVAGQLAEGRQGQPVY